MIAFKLAYICLIIIGQSAVSYVLYGANLTNNQCWERYFKKVISYNYSLRVPKSN